MRAPRFTLLLAASLLLARPLAAQSVPLLTLEGVVGAGQHNVVVGEQSFVKNDAVWTQRVGASIRLGPATRVAAYVKADFAPAITQKVELLQCSGGCVREFPLRSMRSAGLGVRAAVTPSILVGGLVGVGYSGKTGSRESTRYMEGDVTLRVFHHLGVIGGWRYTRWHVKGYPYWYAPATIGLQVF